MDNVLSKIRLDAVCIPRQIGVISKTASFAFQKWQFCIPKVAVLQIDLCRLSVHRRFYHGSMNSLGQPKASKKRDNKPAVQVKKVDCDMGHSCIISIKTKAGLPVHSGF